jgi:RNA polymerase sigma-70 factor (ECF subfamily)
MFPKIFRGKVEPIHRPVIAVFLTLARDACQPARWMVEPADTGVRRARESLAATLADAEPVLTRIAERLCANAADASDLIQDTFERVTRNGLPPDVRNPIGWLATSMHNLFIDRCRAAARRPNHESLADRHADITQLEPDPPEPAWSRITVDDVRKALAEIDASYSTVYVLHTFEHRSYEEIAERLSIQRVTVGTRLNRARKKLREVLVKRFGLEQKDS